LGQKWDKNGKMKKKQKYLIKDGSDVVSSFTKEGQKRKRKRFFF